MEQLINILTIALCIFILIITIISHMDIKHGDAWTIAKEQIRHSKRDTMGKRIYRYLLVIFCLVGVYWGLSPATYFFLFAAIISERMIIYRICRGGKDPVGRFLSKIDW